MIAALFGAGAAVVGERRDDARWTASARRSVYVVASLAASAFALVDVAYLRDDFGYLLVAATRAPPRRRSTRSPAMWSSQAGSLLLWLVILSAQAAVAVHVAHRRYVRLEGVAQAVLLSVCAFFCLLMVAWTSPFEAVSRVPPHGAGLQPLLRYPLMALHPATLYRGYARFSVPFAFAVAALARRQLDATWLLATRRFMLSAWAFLAPATTSDIGGPHLRSPPTN